MNLLDLAGSVWRANEQLIHSTLDLSGNVINKMAELTGIHAKPHPVSPVINNQGRWFSFKKIVIVGGIGAGIYLVYYLLKNRKQRVPYVENFEPDVVYLFQFPRPLSIPSLSPYALKLETWLRMSDINYLVVEDISLFHRSPEGTLPYVELDGQVIVDSANIIDVLTESRDTTDSHLKPDQKAVVRALEVMIELSLNFCSAKYRYENFDEFFKIWSAPFLSLPVVRTLFKWFIVRVANKRIRASSMGKHSNELAEKLGNRELQALSDLLGSKHYLTGFKPTRADAAAFAALTLILYVPFDNPQRRYINKHCQNLLDYAERIRTRFWPDWTLVTTLCKANTDWKRMIKPSNSRPASTAP
ncbi:Failed axon connections-like protein [Aphelenchoides bicaudatus]|nr:Failed axon connections-like protein [Aphelenchoides bicaudatus]